MRGGTGLLVVLLALLAGGLALLFANDGGSVFGLADDDFARLVTLTAITLFLGAGIVLSRRLQLGRAVRHAAIWIALFLLVLIAYSYADDLRAVGHRLQAHLLPGSAVSLDADGRQVMATRTGDDHFRIDAEINGAPVEMLVDTGASIVAIDQPTAERAGIDLSRLRYDTQIRTANGIAQAAPVRLDSLRIGGIERRDVAAVVTDGEGIGIDLLGMSFLGTLSSVEFRGDRLLLRD